ncbi:MAG: hypothetical protein OD811_00555 [Alphaproteobacteria bacterium]
MLISGQYGSVWLGARKLDLFVLRVIDDGTLRREHIVASGGVALGLFHLFIDFLACEFFFLS